MGFAVEGKFGHREKSDIEQQKQRALRKCQNRRKVLDALAVCSKYLSTHKRQNWALVFNKVDPVSSVDNLPCYDIFRAYVPGKSVAKQVDNLGKMARYEPTCKVILEQNPLRKIPRRHKSARERVNLKYNVVSHIDMPSRILIQVNIEL